MVVNGIIFGGMTPTLSWFKQVLSVFVLLFVFIVCVIVCVYCLCYCLCLLFVCCLFQGVSGALAVLMKDAIRPNLMQTLEVIVFLFIRFFFSPLVNKYNFKTIT